MVVSQLEVWLFTIPEVYNSNLIIGNKINRTCYTVK